MAFNDTSKPRDRDKPFHRINLLGTQPPEAQADGFGYRSGCRSPNEVPGIRDPGGSITRSVARELIRAIPAWVPVRGGSQGGNREREIEGTLDRSFQTWTDVPVFQWHRFYDWNFHVIPADGLEFLKGAGNRQEAVAAPFSNVASATSMECEWDCGAWFNGANDTTPGMMFGRDLCWPLASQFLWAAGRWIYDCGHASSFDKTGPREGMMRTELHPVKAIATARWEAFKFKENDFPVPAIQFMFFASKFGGYFDFPSIGDRAYEFIVDLPEHGIPPRLLVSAGHTMSDPLNTAAARAPELIKDINFTPFAGARGKVVTLDPEVTLHTLSPPQAKVKFPMTSLPADADAYGVILSLGWKDPDKRLARNVRKCTVTVNNIVVNDADHESTPEEWLVKVGVNGRWFSLRQDSIRDGDTIRFAKSFELFLSTEDTIFVSSHGSELNLVHDVFARPVANRTLAGVTDYTRDTVDCTLATALTHLDNMASMMRNTVNDQNQPLALIDPGRTVNGANNPLTIGSRLGEVTFSLRGFFTKDDARSAELAQDTSHHEYTLFYTVKIEPVPGL